MDFNSRGTAAPEQRDGLSLRPSWLFRQRLLRTMFRDRWLVCLAVLALVTAVPDCVHAQVTPLPYGQAQREEALHALPMDALHEAARAKVELVLARSSIYRRLPVQTLECDPDLHVFLVRYPEVIVNIWQLMGVTKVQVTRTGPYTFEATDGAGTESRVELLYGRPDLHIYYGQGSYQGALFGNRIRGACVMVVHSAYRQGAKGVEVQNTLDVFVRLENVGAELLAKTLHPLVGKTADQNFIETVKFVGQVAQASETNGPGMQRVAESLSNVDPTVRRSFAAHIENAYQKAMLRGELHTELATQHEPRLIPSDGPPPSVPIPAALHAMRMPVEPRDWAPVFRR